MPARYGPLSQQTVNARTYHASCEKASRHAAEEVREIDKEYEAAFGMCWEYIASKIGITDEFSKLIDNARVLAAKRHQLIEDDAITTNKHMTALHQELKHIHIDIVELQRKLGITEE